MSTFLTGKKLEDAIYDIIWEAKETLMIVSPYIKLDDYFKKLFNEHKDDPNIHLILVFGKNEKSVRKSMSKTDFDFFKDFQNVSIIYVPNLNAKYYGNERKGVITSVNLYDYSFINNIEFGVYSEQSLLDKFKTSADNDAWNECWEIASSNEVVFIKRPAYEKKKGLVNFGPNYVKSEVLLDSTKKFYGIISKTNVSDKRLDDFPDEIELDAKGGSRPERDDIQEKKITGYCIRTGEEIPFNPKQPFTKKAWKSWRFYGNEDFKEKYCHKTGKESKGKTSMRNPIMN